MVSDADAILTDYALMQIPLTGSRFRQEFRNPSTRTSFLEFYRENMQRNYERRLIGPGKYSAEKRTLSKLEMFSPGGILFSQISRRLIEDFDAFHADLLSSRGREGSPERIKALKHIKKYLRAAKEHENGLYKFVWPFHGFVWPKDRPSPTFLTEKEVRILVALYERPDTILARMCDRAKAEEMTKLSAQRYASRSGVDRIRKVMQAFLFQCFSGLRYSDVERVKWSQINGNHLVFIPHKTRRSSGAEVRIYLTNMIRKYLPARDKSRREIFHTISNQKYNIYLKEIAELARIDKRITSHVGRHTFATLSLMRGVKLPTLQRLMGVSKVETLMIYVHITESQQDTALQQAYADFL